MTGKARLLGVLLAIVGGYFASGVLSGTAVALWAWMVINGA